jgi:hypothetical protein
MRHSDKSILTRAAILPGFSSCSRLKEPLHHAMRVDHTIRQHEHESIKRE